MAEFDVHFDDETVEALRRQVCATVDENRDRTGLHSMGVSILCTRLMVEIEEKLFELRRQSDSEVIWYRRALEEITQLTLGGSGTQMREIAERALSGF